MEILAYFKENACTHLAHTKKALITSAFILGYTPMQEVAPRAVSMAVATDAIICTMNLMVSFLVIVVFCFKWLVLSVAGVPPIT